MTVKCFLGARWIWTGFVNVLIALVSKRKSQTQHWRQLPQINQTVHYNNLDMPLNNKPIVTIYAGVVHGLSPKT
jgi:hypothetical protein